ncbi:MAG: hypothetical protein V9G25_04660 [Acidimicrobiia bacterium]
MKRTRHRNKDFDGSIAVQEKSKKKRNFLIPSLTSPIFFIIICALVVAGAFYGTKNISPKSKKIDSINSEFVNLNSVSDSWSCPYLVSNSTSVDNQIIYYNPSDKEANITVHLYNLDGSLLSSKDFKLKSKSSLSELVSTYGENVNASGVIESFGSPIVVYRNIVLSDGPEVLPCVKNPKDILELDNLTTAQYTNTTLILNNPFSADVVVDVNARLVDNTQSPFKVLLDDAKAIVIPGHGRVDIDVQKTFGRYPMINLTVQTRSGFISGEAIVNKQIANTSNGQTIVTSSLSNYTNDTSYIFGNSPLTIYAQSNLSKSAALDIKAYGTDNRTIATQEQSINVGSTISIADPGVEFGFHVVEIISNAGKIITKNGASNDEVLAQNRSSFVSYVGSFTNNETLSASTVTSLTSKSIVLVARDSDTLGLFNPSTKTTKVNVSFIDTNIKQLSFEIGPNSFFRYVLNEVDLKPGVVVLSIDSTQDLVASSSRIGLSGITNGVYIKK